MEFRKKLLLELEKTFRFNSYVVVYIVRMDRLKILSDMCRSGCDWKLGIRLQVRKFLRMDFYIFD